MNDTYLTAKEVAELLKISVSAVHHNWPKWKVEYGIKPIRLNGHHKGRLMWKKSQLIAMAEKQWAVI